MPHVIVELWPGKSESQKARLTYAIVDGVTGTPFDKLTSFFGKHLA